MRYIFLLILTIITNYSFSQDMKDYLEKKADRYIENAIRESSYEFALFPEEDHTLIPFEWYWRGYKKPIRVDSLVCKSPVVMNWAEEQLRYPYDTLSWLERERTFQVIRVDTLNGRTVLCSVNIFYELGSHAIYEYVEFYSKKSVNKYERKGDWDKGNTPHIKGYWWVDNKCVFVVGNAVDLLFEIHKNRKMGSPLPPHRTIDDKQGEVGRCDLTDGTYWIYNDETLTQYYFDEIEYKQSDKYKEGIPHQEWISIGNKHYFKILQKSFDYYKL